MKFWERFLENLKTIGLSLLLIAFCLVFIYLVMQLGTVAGYHT